MLYRIWYKKEIKAKSLKEAIRQADKVKPKFTSVETEEPKPQDFSPAIGFQYHNEDEV